MREPAFWAILVAGLSTLFFALGAWCSNRDCKKSLAQAREKNKELEQENQQLMQERKKLKQELEKRPSVAECNALKERNQWLEKKHSELKADNSRRWSEYEKLEAEHERTERELELIRRRILWLEEPVTRMQAGLAREEMPSGEELKRLLDWASATVELAGPIRSEIFGVRACNALQRAGIDSLSAFIARSPDGELSAKGIRDLGDRSIAKIEEYLIQRGIKTQIGQDSIAETPA